MRVARFVLLIVCLLAFVPAWGQQAAPPELQTQPGTTPPPAAKDPQAVNILNQALTAVGGIPAIAAVTDYTGTGNVTFYMDIDRNVQGSGTVRGNGLAQFRLDAILPSGVRSESINGLVTTKTEDGGIQKFHSQPPINPARFILPYLQLIPGLNSSAISISYKGIVQIDGVSAHDIVLRQNLSTANANEYLKDYLTTEFFIDVSSLQILMMQDFLAERGIRQVRYSDYKPINGVLVPFTISEQVNGQLMRLIQLSQFTFNAGLQDSDFQL